MHNPDNREVIKIDGSEMLLIFDDVTKEWTRFMPALDNQLSVCKFYGLREIWIVFSWPL